MQAVYFTPSNMNGISHFNPLPLPPMVGMKQLGGRNVLIGDVDDAAVVHTGSILCKE